MFFLVDIIRETERKGVDILGVRQDEDTIVVEVEIIQLEDVDHVLFAIHPIIGQISVLINSEICIMMKKIKLMRLNWCYD